MAESTDDTGSAFETVATAVNTITASVDELVYSSSQLRGWADSLRTTVNGLMLSDLSPLTNSARLQEAQRQFASAQVIAEETGDMSGLSGAAQTYLKEAASYYASSGPYIAIFGEVTGYLSSMAGKAETEAQRAERIESIQAAQAEAQRIATEAVTAATREADTASRTAAQQQQQQLQLQTLLAEQQRIELALANSHAIDAEGVLSAQLQAMIDVNAGVQSLAHLLSMLPGDLAAAIGGAVGVAPQQYGGDLVNQLYQQVLGRQGEASGVAYWQSVQQQGFGT
jgi:hypothetical protein